MISRTTSKDATRTSRQDDGTTTTTATTTFGQTVVQLVKGYIGCGILSLPWAISQLGIPLGVFSIGVMSIWTSYNCWTIVQLKRYISAQRSTATTAIATPAATATTIIHGSRIRDNNNNNNNNDDDDDDENDDREDGDTSRVIAITRRTRKPRTKTPSQPRRDRDHGIIPSVTYPELGRWAYGRNFHTYVAICVCAQQLAICTVFISFVCANITATCQYLSLIHI